MGQLPQIWPNPVKIMAGARFGRISKKEPDARLAGAEIRYIPTNKADGQNKAVTSTYMNNTHAAVD